jgi:hypothetical protein
MQPLHVSSSGSNRPSHGWSDRTTNAAAWHWRRAVWLVLLASSIPAAVEFLLAEGATTFDDKPLAMILTFHDALNRLIDQRKPLRQSTEAGFTLRACTRAVRKGLDETYHEELLRKAASGLSADFDDAMKRCCGRNSAAVSTSYLT